MTHRIVIPKLLLTAGAVLVFFALLVGVPSLSSARGSFQDPSNLVGIWKMTLEPGVHMISFPLLPQNATLESVLGNQFPGGEDWESGTRIMTNGENALRGSYFDSNSQQWVGTLQQLELRKGYWLVIPDDAEPVSLTLLGAALDADEVDMGTMRPGTNLVSAGFPYPSSLAASGLVESGLSGARYIAASDRIYTWTAGSLAPAWYNPQQGWSGSPFGFEPGRGYIIVVAPGHDEFNWSQPRPDVYTPGNPHGAGVTPVNVERMMLPLPRFDTPPWENGKSPKPVNPARKNQPPPGAKQGGRTAR